MNKKFTFFFFILSLFTGVSTPVNAQMKSCCEPDGTILVSTVKQTAGTLKMAQILDSIGRHANPENFYLMNNARMALFEKKLAIEKDPYKRVSYYFQYANEALNAGKTDEAIGVLQQVIAVMKFNAENLTIKNRLFFDLLAIAFMRKGELENCAANHTAQSCIIPIQGGGLHTLTTGSESAIEIYKMLLTQFPDDLQSRYLLNIAYMTLGKYPAQVPKQWLIGSAIFNQTKSDIVLKDVAVSKGVDMNGISGGCVVEDLDNDGLPDIMASSYGLSDQIRYMHQQKDGTFKNETLASGLVGITGGLNLIHADYNNDGFADIIVLRGGWLGKDARFPFSLLKNNGQNNFEDVTIDAGLYSAAPTQTASWGDFNNDGWIDLFVSHEGYPCQLFMNVKGKFKDVAPKYGLNILAFVKGCIWGDINNDGFPELYLSVLNGPNKLWLNKPGKTPGERTFEDISKSAGVEEPIHSFPTWFFDFDNDGFEDLYVSGYDTKMYSDVGGDAARDMLGIPTLGEKPKLYHNNGNNTFTDVSAAYGVDHVNYTMGCNFGDIDNDGWPDFYLGTGAPEFTSIVPNKLYRNMDGKRFEDITYATNTGHIQKGHAVAFADIDNDGDQDIYAVMGGATEGDRFRNVLFENSTNNGNRWIKLKLEGTTSNKAAIGAKIRIKVKQADGSFQNFYHVVNTGGSFGSNPLLVTAGIGKAISIEEVEIKWPNAKNSTGTLRNLAVNSLFKIKEGFGIQ
ncbi:MAG: CRTAC1 family protein [Chitinophagaceae bacterium]|nr:CRTAC1 family protein [Chitinophagaceae bacterium]